MVLFNAILNKMLIVSVQVVCFVIITSYLLEPIAYGAITREEAKQVLLEKVITGDPNAENLMAFGPQDMLQVGDVVAPFLVDRQPYPGVMRTVDRQTWFFWINDDINDLFMHPTRFVYIDANNPNPVLGDGITIDQGGWWPRINSVDFYRNITERTEESEDWVYGHIPEEPHQGENAKSKKRNKMAGSDNKSSANTYAIIISGESNSLFEKSMSNYKDALQNSVAGPGIPESNIIMQSNCSISQLESHISVMNGYNVDTLYVFVGAHGGKEGVVLDGVWCSSEEFASTIGETSASEVKLVTEACWDGTLVDEMQANNFSGTMLTATDGEHYAKGRGAWILTSGGSFIKELTEIWQDGQEQITLEEAYQKLMDEECAWWDIWCKDVKEQEPTITFFTGSAAGIPTLSEWKRIVLTLLLFSLIMGYTNPYHAENANSRNHGWITVYSIGQFIFNPRLYFNILGKAALVGTIVLTGMTFVSNSIDILDVFGILFCIPLVAYNIHLLVLVKLKKERV